MVRPRWRWGIAGLGVAGRARARALRELDQELVGHLRGGGEGLRAYADLPTLLPEVEAMAVCAPDDAHPELVEAALRAGRHVLCEYPLAPSETEARRLFALAQERGLAVWVGHIEQWSPEMGWLRQKLEGAALMGGGLRASGPARPGTASLAHAHLARLSRLISLWGSPARVEPELNQPDRLVGALRYGRHVAIGVDLQLREEGRRQELVLETDRGTISQVGQTLFHNGQLVLPARGEGLFLQDSRRALEALRAGAIEPENMRLELAALEVADALAAWS